MSSSSSSRSANVNGSISFQSNQSAVACSGSDSSRDGTLTGTVDPRDKAFVRPKPEVKPLKYDPNFKPTTPEPAKTPRKLHRCVATFFKLIVVNSLVHVFLAAAFMYFSIHFMTTSYYEYPSVCFTTSNNVTTLLTDFSHLSDQQQSECERFARWYVLSLSHWKFGVIAYSVMNGVAAFVGALYLWWLYRVLLKMQPKTSGEVLMSLFHGFPKGAFMISYAWNDETQFFQAEQGYLPRKVGGFFPCSWLDIENLIPGTPVKEACGRASEAAAFRFAFISSAYLKSQNCLAEWTHIEAEPGRCIIFAYPSTPKDVIKQLEAKKHCVVPLTPETRHEVLNPDWFLTHFIRSRRANPLFSLYSPAINERWRPTLRFWNGQKSSGFLKHSLPMIVIAVVVSFFDFFLMIYFNLVNIFRGFEGCGILFCGALLLPLLVLLLGFYIMYYLWKTGYHKRGLPDVAYLLVFLSRLGVIDEIKFFSNSDDVISTSDFKMLNSTEAVEVVPNRKDAHISCLLIDEVDDGGFKKDELDTRFIFWTKGGFLNLSQGAKDLFGTYLIGEEVPGVEFLCTKMLMITFKINAENLTLGHHPFETLFAKKDLDHQNVVVKKQGCCGKCCGTSAVVRKSSSSSSSKSGSKSASGSRSGSYA